jgi:hypothetical protein
LQSIWVEGWSELYDGIASVIPIAVRPVPGANARNETAMERPVQFRSGPGGNKGKSEGTLAICAGADHRSRTLARAAVSTGGEVHERGSWSGFSRLRRPAQASRIGSEVSREPQPGKQLHREGRIAS